MVLHCLLSWPSRGALVTSPSMEGEDLREPLSDCLQHGAKLRELACEGLDAVAGLSSVGRVVDPVELLQEPARMPQFRVFDQRRGQAGGLLGAEMVGARQLQVACSEDHRRERWPLPGLAHALHPPTHLVEPGGEPPHHVEAITDVGRVPEVAL
jgi:hypothetical protein